MFAIELCDILTVRGCEMGLILKYGQNLESQIDIHHFIILHKFQVERRALRNAIR